MEAVGTLRRDGFPHCDVVYAVLLSRKEKREELR